MSYVDRGAGVPVLLVHGFPLDHTMWAAQIDALAGAAWIVVSLLAVVLLYQLKPSPRRLTVSSALVWRRVLRERARTPDRLRWWVSLLLAVAVALMLALGLTRPELGAFGGAAERVLLVLDNSATLATLTADGKTRWNHAIERAREIVRAGGPGSRYMVADAQRTIASPRFEEPDVALATLGRLRLVTGGRPVFPDVPRVGGSGVRTVLATDGVADLLPPAQTETLSVFQPADNVGITAFDLRAAPGDRRRYQAFVEVLVPPIRLLICGAGGDRQPDCGVSLPLAR
jgi:pimeloyl-ACP methyl ester carboxylesterase